MIKRIFLMIPILGVVAVCAFFITYITPGDPVRLILGQFATDQQVSLLRSQLGLDQSLTIQFFTWFGNIIRGDLGQSIFLHIPVTEAILSRIEPTFLLTFNGMLIGIVFGVFFGVLSAVMHNSWLDQISIGISLVGISIPGFWLAFILMLFFGVHLHWFPVCGYQPIAKVGLVEALRYLALPSLTLGIMQTGLIARMVRSALLDVLSQDYIRTARAKGLNPSRIVFEHGLKNAMIPTITVIGFSFGLLLGGTWIVETIFFIPGTGQLAISAIIKRDFPLIQGSMIFAAFIYVLVNLMVDICYGILDPRVRQ